jgi:hypothetical protein
MLEICIQTSYDKNVQLILKSYLPVVYGTSLITHLVSSNFSYDWTLQEYYKASLCVRTNTTLSFVIRSDHTVIGPYKNTEKKDAMWLVNFKILIFITVEKFKHTAKK